MATEAIELTSIIETEITVESNLGTDPIELSSPINTGPVELASGLATELALESTFDFETL